MATKKEETASFVLRFTQKIYEGESGESEVQWRGQIRHVQGGDEKRFAEFEDAVQFIQTKLADLTISATEDKSPEEQKGILTKSFELWKQVTEDYPQKIIETIKDPRGSVEQLQEQVQEQVTQMSDRIRPTLDPDAWKPATKADLRKALDGIEGMIAQLNEKIEKLAKS